MTSFHNFLRTSLLYLFCYEFNYRSTTFLCVNVFFSATLYRYIRPVGQVGLRETVVRPEHKAALSCAQLHVQVPFEGTVYAVLRQVQPQHFPLHPPCLPVMVRQNDLPAIKATTATIFTTTRAGPVPLLPHPEILNSLRKKIRCRMPVRCGPGPGTSPRAQSG